VAEVWAPTVADVARYIPTRTRDTTTPGSDALLGTFGPNTTPTDSQAQSIIDDAVGSVVAAVGELPAAPPADIEIYSQARVAAAFRAAADIEMAYPNRDADVALAVLLGQRADKALATLVTALQVLVGGPVDLLPSWQMPLPETWGDSLWL
jgi:hypothetical protein